MQHKKDKDKKKDLVKQAKQFLKNQLSASEGGAGPSDSQVAAALAATGPLPPIQVAVDEKSKITEDSYFQRNAEFTVWLQVGVWMIAISTQDDCHASMQHLHLITNGDTHMCDIFSK